MTRPDRRGPGPFLAVGFCLLVLLAVLAPWLATKLGSSGRVFAAGEAEVEAPVALVLGAAVGPDGVPSPYLQARLDTAAELYADGQVGELVVSGNKEESYDEPEAMRRSLVADGVPASAIVEDPYGYDTYDSCVRLHEVYGVDSAVLVSQAYHLPRAVTICRAVGVDAVGVADTSVGTDSATWSRNEVREFPASWKMVADLVIGREPVMTGEPLDATG